MPDNLFADTLNQTTVNRHRLGKYTKDNYSIHVSDLMQSSKERIFCAREHAINFHENRGGELIKKLTPAMSLLYSMGNAVQDHLTAKFIQHNEYGHTLWGDWSCGCKKTKIRYSLKPNGRCNHCAGPIDRYCEVDLRQPKYNLVGHPDLLVLWPPYLHIFEVKSIDRQDLPFDDIKEPLGDHTLQGTFYYWMLLDMYMRGEIPYKPHDVVRYLYVDRSNKKLFFGEPYKEFQKRRSDAARLKPMLDRATTMMQSLSGRTLPPRICSDVLCTRAKGCTVQTSCFNRKSNILDSQNDRSRLRPKSPR